MVAAPPPQPHHSELHGFVSLAGAARPQRLIDPWRQPPETGGHVMSDLTPERPRPFFLARGEHLAIELPPLLLVDQDADEPDAEQRAGSVDRRVPDAQPLPWTRARFGVSHDDRRVIDAEEQPGRCALPS